MNLARLSWTWLWSRPAAAALHLLILGLGVAAIVLVALVSDQLERQARRDLAGIDLVVGAKGSPLQLILAGVFHIDVPPGNIPLAAAAQMREHPLAEQVVPLALGDSVMGWRIVGTDAGLLALYGATLADGRAWQAPLEAVVGSGVAQASGLAPGRQFEGEHGLGGGGEKHGEHPYTVVGRLAPCGCVLDRLVLTGVESVWAVHEGDTALDDEDRRALEAERELTLLLVRYRSPLAAVTLPRWVNAQPGLQAAVPALEAARLFRNLGAGLQLLRGFGVVLVLVAALSLWLALMQAVREREADLAMLRLLGAPPQRLALLLVLEALWLVALALAAGLVAGHGLAHALGLALQAERSLPLTGLAWTPQHPWLLVTAPLVALAAVAAPVRRVLRLPVTTLLQSPR